MNCQLHAPLYYRYTPLKVATYTEIKKKMFQISIDLPDYLKITFPETAPVPLEDLVPEAPDEAVNLFKKFILYDSENRVSAAEALLHRYFYTAPMAARLEEMPMADHCK